MEMKEKITILLSKIKHIVSEANKLLEEKERKGEYFNIFEILNLSKYEEKLHTPFITELLNPNGSHGLKDKFLQAFIRIAHLDVNFDYSSTSVKSEFNIGYISSDYTKGGRIDIIIQDRYKNAIIIENKIYADDKKNQMLRYDNYAKDNKLNYRLLYLTLYGSCASDNALGHKPISYECISYRETILNWLDECVVIASSYPLVRETIRQYISNIKMLLNIMDTTNLNELVKIAISPEYYEATLSIISNQWEIEVQIRKQFIDSLSLLSTKKCGR